MTIGVIHYATDARQVGECRSCGGALLFVEDHGAPRPLEAQCQKCGVLTGVGREWSPQATLAPVAPGSPEDIGF